MGILSWLRGEPRVGDRDYETYQTVRRQLDPANKNPPTSGTPAPKGLSPYQYGRGDCWPES